MVGILNDQALARPRNGRSPPRNGFPTTMPIQFKRRSLHLPELARAERTATSKALTDLRRLALFLGGLFSERHTGQALRGRYEESLKTWLLVLDGLPDMQVGVHLPTWSVHVYIDQRLRLQYPCRQRALADVGQWMQKQPLLTSYTKKTLGQQQSSAAKIIGSHGVPATQDVSHWIVAAQRSLRLASTSPEDPHWQVATMTLEVPAGIDGASVTLGMTIAPGELPYWYLKQGEEQLGQLKGASLCNRIQSDQRYLISAFVLRGEVTDEFSPSSEETE